MRFTPALIISYSIVILLISCTNDQKPQAGRSKTVRVECYFYMDEKDTVKLQFVNLTEFVTGTLNYKLHEKDMNSGILSGKMEGDLLIADYKFTSEGKTSIREVVFKKQGNAYVEGYGPVESRDDKTVFINYDSLSFDNSRVLSKGTCPVQKEYLN